MIAKIPVYFQLTKPSIMLLVVLTSATALIIEGSMLQQPAMFVLILLATFLSGGAANALNQFFEREIDARMTRTASRRPLPQKQISDSGALVFSILIGLGGVTIFASLFNWFSALMSLGTILFYSFIYTLLLKPNTTQNIVIGGAAGAMAPVGAWIAATGHMALEPWILFLIIFLWTPPHFWALALYYKKDYDKANLPMMPNVKGKDATLRQMIVYTWLLVAISLTLLISTSMSVLYGISALWLGILFLRKTYQAKSSGNDKQIKGVFSFSIIYLMVLFTIIIIDGLLVL